MISMSSWSTCPHDGWSKKFSWSVCPHDQLVLMIDDQISSLDQHVLSIKFSSRWMTKYLLNNRSHDCDQYVLQYDQHVLMIYLTSWHLINLSLEDLCLFGCVLALTFHFFMLISCRSLEYCPIVYCVIRFLLYLWYMKDPCLHKESRVLLFLYIIWRSQEKTLESSQVIRWSLWCIHLFLSVLSIMIWFWRRDPRYYVKLIDIQIKQLSN